MWRSRAQWTGSNSIESCAPRSAGRRRRALPPLVVRRAKSLGAVGEAWLANLDAMIAELEAEWQISVGEALPGGSRAFVACADGPHGEPYALKIDLPEDMGGEFFRGMAALRMADGRGCAKVYAFDPKRRACLLERLGKPINRMGSSAPSCSRPGKSPCRGRNCSAARRPSPGSGISSGRPGSSWAARAPRP